MLITTCVILLFLYVPLHEGIHTESSGSIHGRVLTSSNQPAPGVELALFTVERTQNGYSVVKDSSGTSDKHGNYRIDKVAPGPHMLEATLPGFGKVNVWGISMWRGLDRVVDVALPIDPIGGSIGMVNGKVLTEKGKPIEDATVTLGNTYSVTPQYQVRTGRDGEFVILPTFLGRHVLIVTKPGFGIGFRSLDVEAGDSEAVHIQLQEDAEN